MKATTLALALCLASFGASQVVPIGPFTGANVSDFEDQPLINSGDTTATRLVDTSSLRVTSNGGVPPSLSIFDNDHLDYAYRIYFGLGEPEIYGFARNGKTLSARAEVAFTNPIHFRFKDLTSYGVLRFGGWFMMNDRDTIRFQFTNDFGDVLAERTVTGTADPEYKWVGWEVEDPFVSRYKGFAVSYSSYLSGQANFHLDDFQWDVAPVPEPGTLLALGAGGLALLRRRSRQ